MVPSCSTPTNDAATTAFSPSTPLALADIRGPTHRLARCVRWYSSTALAAGLTLFSINRAEFHSQWLFQNYLEWGAGPSIGETLMYEASTGVEIAARIAVVSAVASLVAYGIGQFFSMCLHSEILAGFLSLPNGPRRHRLGGRDLPLATFALATPAPSVHRPDACHMASRAGLDRRPELSAHLVETSARNHRGASLRSHDAPQRWPQPTQSPDPRCEQRGEQRNKTRHSPIVSPPLKPPIPAKPRKRPTCIPAGRGIRRRYWASTVGTLAQPEIMDDPGPGGEIDEAKIPSNERAAFAKAKTQNAGQSSN